MSAARFAMDGRDYLRRQRARRDRDRTHAARARGDPASAPRSASPSRATGRFIAGQSALRGDVRLGRSASSPASRAQRRLGQRRATTPRSAALAGPLLSARPAVRGRARDAAQGRQPVLVPPARRRSVDRTHPSHGGTIWIADDVTERTPLDAGAGGGARRRRGREPRQERLPRQHQPRDPHAAERRARPGAAGDAAPTRRRAAPALPRADRRQRAGRWRRSSSTSSTCRRSRPASSRSRTLAVRPARGAREPCTHAVRARWPRQGPALALDVDADVPATVLRRPGAGAPDPHQLHHQRDQVHRARQRARSSAGAAAPRRCGSSRRRHRHRHRRRRRRQRLFQPFSQADALDDAALRRHRPGPVDLPRAGAA